MRSFFYTSINLVASFPFTAIFSLGTLPNKYKFEIDKIGTVTTETEQVVIFRLYANHIEHIYDEYIVAVAFFVKPVLLQTGQSILVS